LKILIVKPSSFGDIVQALPVATGLKRHWPQAEIHWLTFDIYESFLQNHRAIDKLWVWRKKRWRRFKYWGEAWRWGQALRAEKFDMVLDLQGLLRSAVWTWCTGAPRRLGLWGAREGAILFYNEKILDPPPPAQEKYLEFLRYLGIRPEPHDFQIEAPPLAITALENRAYIALHPYSRWRTKMWPWRYYVEVMEAMPEQHFVLVGEGPWFPAELPNCFDLRNRLPIPQLAAVLHKARAHLTTDSGPAHLSAALGVPTVVLFGPTDWPCAPCRKRVCPQLQPVVCMSAITPREVVQHLRAILKEEPDSVAQQLLRLECK
jgi:heptosyltransferase I